MTVVVIMIVVMAMLMSLVVAGIRYAHNGRAEAVRRPAGAACAEDAGAWWAPVAPCTGEGAGLAGTDGSMPAAMAVPIKPLRTSTTISTK